jgi:hypothetical protein
MNAAAEELKVTAGPETAKPFEEMSTHRHRQQTK